MPISFSSHSARDARARGAGVTAVLGPTNTGKTHLAIERMLAHSSGMIGLPLRLLAREVYNKCVERVGAELRRARHRRRKDQAVQSALLGLDHRGDAARSRCGVRGDRRNAARRRSRTRARLHRPHAQPARPRGDAGARRRDDARRWSRSCFPARTSCRRPRLSTLNFAGEKKLTRLPRRTAIVTFSADEVYEIAELIRRQRGGAAVVLGSLSPRTRNAQVALYQSGDVDYLVATDAIGMGLNLDVDHVAFAADRKFDGYQFRKLNPSELAQIAGRAGRATRDGTFGTTGRCPPFEPELAQALESHTFDSVKVLQWRNTALDFSSARRTRGVAGADAGRTGAHARADRRRYPSAGACFARRRGARTWPHPAPRSSGCGRSARFRTIARFRPPPMRSWPSPSMVSSCGRVQSRPNGSPGRLRRRTAPTAISIRSRTGSPTSGPGPLRQTVRTGSPIPSTGKASRAAWRTSCPTRCTSVWPSASSTAAPAC